MFWKQASPHLQPQIGASLSIKIAFLDIRAYCLVTVTRKLIHSLVINSFAPLRLFRVSAYLRSAAYLACSHHPRFRAKLPMDQRPRKRRAINACANCRTSKVRCDGSRPCDRCNRNGTPCIYHDAANDEIKVRVERLEREVAALRGRPNESPPSATPIETIMHPVTRIHMRERSAVSSSVDAGIITHDQATLWFQR